MDDETRELPAEDWTQGPPLSPPVYGQTAPQQHYQDVPQHQYVPQQQYVPQHQDVPQYQGAQQQYDPTWSGSYERPKLPGGLKALSITVTVVKAVPLLFMLIIIGFFAVAAAFFGQQIDADDTGFAAVFTGIFIVAAIFAAIAVFLASSLLIAQLVTTIRNSWTGLIVTAGILAAIDALLVLGSILNVNEVRTSEFAGDSTGEAVGSLVLFLAIAVAQGAVFVWALLSSRSTSRG